MQHWKKRTSQALIAALAVGLVATFAFAWTFTTFSPFDDEGTFLQSYREFLSGRIPYDQVFALYGPFTFISAALVARFNVVNVTDDTFRWALLPAWILIASLIAGAVWRWTGRYSAALVAFLLIGYRLRNLVESVGHPQLWIILSVAVLVWLGGDWMYSQSEQRPALWTGIAVGVILLCKINIGAFVSIAIALAVSLQLRGRLRTLACGSLFIAGAGLGLSLFFLSSIRSEKYFALAFLESLAMIVGIAIFRPAEQQPSWKSLKWLVAGFGACLFAGVGATLAWGTTARGLFRGLVTYPALLVRAYHQPFLDVTRRYSVLLLLCGIGVAIGAVSWRRLAKLGPARLGLIKIMVGGGLVCVFFYNPRQALPGSLLFLWLLLVDAQPMAQPAYFNRLLLALLCSLLSLQLFPVAGTQVEWAALMPAAAAVVLLADGINSLEIEPSVPKLRRVTLIVARATAPVLALFLFLVLGKNTAQRLQLWRSSEPVNLPGTHWLRLPPMEEARLTVTVSTLTRDCQSLLTLPGLYSFSLWSGVPPAEERRINSWIFLWPDEVQKNELHKLRQQPQGCVLVSQDMYDFFRTLAASPGNDAFLSEIQRSMTPIFRMQDLTLYRSSQPSEASPNPARLIPGAGAYPGRVTDARR